MLTTFSLPLHHHHFFPPQFFSFANHEIAHHQLWMKRFFSFPNKRSIVRNHLWLRMSSFVNRKGTFRKFVSFHNWPGDAHLLLIPPCNLSLSCSLWRLGQFWYEKKNPSHTHTHTLIYHSTRFSGLHNDFFQIKNHLNQRLMKSNCGYLKIHTHSTFSYKIFTRYSSFLGTKSGFKSTSLKF